MEVRFSEPVQTSLKAHTACRAMDIADISPTVKRPGCSRDRLTTYKVKVKERVELYFYPLHPLCAFMAILG